MKNGGKLDGTDYAILGAIILAIVIGRIVYASLTYSDWTCAFANCTKVQVIEPKK